MLSKFCQRKASPQIGFSQKGSTQVEWMAIELATQQKLLDKMKNDDIIEFETHYHNAAHTIFLERNEDGEKINNAHIEGEITKENTIHLNWKD